MQFLKGTKIYFSCSDFGWYLPKAVKEESKITMVNYELRMSHTPLFLIAGKYKVYITINGVLDKSRETVSYQSKPKGFSVSTTLDEPYVMNFSYVDIKGKCYINNASYTINDTFYCFSYYQYHNTDKKHLLYTPNIWIMDGENIIETEYYEQNIHKKH